MKLEFLLRSLTTIVSVLITSAMLALLPTASATQPTTAAQDECRDATRMVTRGGPRTATLRAVSRIRECGAQAGSAVADAIRQNRASRDTATLDRLGEVAAVLRDGKMFDAGLDVLGDASASPEARIVAARTLVMGLQPYLYMTGAQLARGDCFGEMRGPHSQGARSGSPMQPDFAERAKTVGERVFHDSTAPMRVRSAARCVAFHKAAPFREPVDAPGYIIVSQHVTIEYLCGDRFRVRNPYETEIDLRYDVDGGRERGSVTLAARSERVVRIRGARVRLLDEDGAPLRAADNENRACAP